MSYPESKFCNTHTEYFDNSVRLGCPKCAVQEKQQLQTDLDAKMKALENIVKAADRLEETLAYMEMRKIAEQAIKKRVSVEVTL